MAQKSADLYYDGLILESHICPAKAWSDASQQVTPSDLETLLRSIVWRQSTADTPEFHDALAGLRRQIDQIDAELFELLSTGCGLRADRRVKNRIMWRYCRAVAGAVSWIKRWPRLHSSV